jgi:O-antigen ligase
VTSLAVQVEGDRTGGPARTAVRSNGELLEHVAMLALLIVWAAPLARADGGRGPHQLLILALVLVPVLAAVGIWRASSKALIAVLGLGLAAMGVCLFAPTGWAGGDTAAGYVLTAVVFAVARRYVRDEDINRRGLVAAGICLAGTYQFALGFQTWWSGRDPSAEMIGTFDAHNPFAVFLMPAAVIGLALVAERRKPWHYVGWVSVPLCTAGVVLSSSRATLAVMVLAFLVILVGSARSRSTALRVVAALALAAAVTTALPGPPLFTHRTSPFAATSERAGGGETLSRNGHFRKEFWQEAARVAEHHPLTGAGYHSLETAGALYSPTSWKQSSFALNGYLQTVSDGGLLLAVPWFAGLLLLAWWSVRRMWAWLGRKSSTSSDFVTIGAAVAVLGVLAHSMVDFEWAYPAVTIELALMAACVAPATRSKVTHRSMGAWAVGGRAMGSVGLVALLVLSIPVLHRWQADQSTTSGSPATLLAASGATFGDYRPAEVLLNQVANGQVKATRPQVVRALELTKREATVDIGAALLRDAVAARYHLDPQAGEHAATLVGGLDGITSAYTSDLAFVYFSAGQPAQARQVLGADIAAQVKTGSGANVRTDLVLWAQHFGTGTSYACQLKSVRGLPGAPPVTSLPAATAQCPS